MASLPPELDRLGDQLAAAAARTRDKRHRRADQRRLALAGVVGALALVVLSPAPLGPALREVTLANATVLPPGCDTPRGHGFMLERCEAAKAARPHRPYNWR